MERRLDINKMSEDLRNITNKKEDLKPEYIPFPIAFRTVDVVPYYYFEEGKWPTVKTDLYYLLGRKPGLTQWQCIGGFVDPTDISAEEAAKRELKEEANIDINSTLLLGVNPNDLLRNMNTWNPKGLFYIGSHQIDDERYKNTSHKIITNLYLVPLLEEPEIKAGDDIEELRWFSRTELSLKKEEIIVKKHLILVDNFLHNT